MKISIHKYLQGAREASGVAVLFDVFRASNTIIACLQSGAEYIIPVGELEEAYRLKEKYPDHLLFGERNGIPPPGFDSDNSPAQAAARKLKGKKIILTTSAGSQGIVYSNKTDQLLIGSFANAEAIVAYLKEKKPPHVSLIAIGNKAVEPALEDEACAEYIQNRVLKKVVDFAAVKRALLACSGADRLRKLKQEKDLAFCTQLDSAQIIPVFERENNRIRAL